MSDRRNCCAAGDKKHREGVFFFLSVKCHKLILRHKPKGNKHSPNHVNILAFLVQTTNPVNPNAITHLITTNHKVLPL